MKLYQYTGSDAEKVSASNTCAVRYARNGKRIVVFSEYAPEYEALKKYQGQEMEAADRISVTEAARYLGLSAGSCEAFLVKNGLLELDKETQELVPTDKGFRNQITTAKDSFGKEKCLFDTDVWMERFYKYREAVSRCTGPKAVVKPLSLTALCAMIGMDASKVRGFFVKEGLMRKEGAKTVPTGELEGNGTYEREYRGEKYLIYGPQWADYILAHKDEIEQAADTPAPAAAPAQDKAPAKEKEPAPAAAPAEAASISVFRKLGIPDDALFIDTETTGMAEDDEVVEIGIVDISGRKVFDSLVRASKPINEKARAVNKISDSILVTAPAYTEIAETLEKIVAGHPLVGHNVSFDIRLLSQTHKKYMDGKMEDFWQKAVLFDTRMISKEYLKISKHSLDSLCKCLGWKGDETHRAADDAYQCLWLAKTLETRPFAKLG